MKLYAIKTYSQNQNRPQGIPVEWPEKQIQIDESEKQNFEQLGWLCLTSDEYKAYLEKYQEAFNTWFDNQEDARFDSRLKILDLVDDPFRLYHPAKIDFTIHLKPGIVLQKTTKMARNGRPEVCEYYYENQKMAEIKFEFDVDARNFVRRWREHLGYVRGDGTIKDWYPISDKSFSQSDLADRAAVIDERSSARQMIMKEIKAVLSDVLILHYVLLPELPDKKTPEEIWAIAGAFWNQYSSSIDAWYNTATSELKEKIQADTETEFLDLNAPANFTQDESDKTVRQYIIDRITY